jgi:hypothetical protein
MGGAWMPRMLTVGFRQEGMGKLLNRFLRSYSHNIQSPLEDLLSGKFELPKSKVEYRTELKELFNELELTERSESEIAPFAYSYVKLANLEYGFIPLSKDVLPEEIKEIISSENSLNRIVKRAERMLADTTIPFSIHTAAFIGETSRKIPTSLGLPLRISTKTPTVMQASGTLKLEVDEKSLSKVRVVVKDFKPSIVSTHIVKVEAWSPIVNSGVKVLAQAKVYWPFDLAVSVDIKKQPVELKMAVSPKFDKREEIVSLQTRPISFTLDWPKFLEEWKEPNEKTIHAEEWDRVKTREVEFGEESVGIKMQVRAHWHRTPLHRVAGTPMLPFAGVNKYTLTVEPGQDMPKEFVTEIRSKLFRSFDKKEINPKFAKFYKDSSEDFLSRESSEEQTENENINQQYRNTFKGEFPVQNEMQIEMYTTGSSQPRKIITDLSLMCGQEEKTCKSNIEIRVVRANSKKDLKFEAEITTLHPRTPFTVSEITSDKRFYCEIDSKWGVEQTMKNKLRAKIVAEQSHKMLSLKSDDAYSRLYNQEANRNSYESLFSPVAQFKKTMRYSLLDEIKVDVDYEMPKFEQQVMSSIYRWVKHVYYWESSVDDVQMRNSEGRVRVKLNIDPVNRRYLNVSIWTPLEEANLTDVALPIEASFVNMRRVAQPSRSWAHFLRQIVYAEEPLCELRTNRMRTFDGVEYDVPTSTCYTVLAKDCISADRSKFAVLIKKEKEGTEKKILKILTEDIKLIIRLKQDKLECELDGQKKSCEQLREVLVHNSHVALSVRMYNDNYMRVELPEAGLRVYFDGLSANLKVSPVYRSHLCGLCGQFDLDTDNEFMSSDRRLVDRKSMFESFLAESKDCKHEFEDIETVLSFDDDRFDDLEESLRMPVRSEDQSVRPIEVTEVIEQAHEICFSKRPVPKCPEHTFPVEHEQKKQKVVFSCLPRREPKAERYLRQVRYQDDVIEEVADLKATFTETIRVPKICRPY